MTKDAFELSSIVSSLLDDGIDEEKGGFDSSSLFSSTTTLFGRQHESDRLLEAFQQVTAHHTAVIAVVHGQSGMGKTRQP
jgi:DNA-binding NtrC family response regulator